MKEINLDITHKCTLKCGGCNRQDENYTIVKSEITIDVNDYDLKRQKKTLIKRKFSCFPYQPKRMFVEIPVLCY